MTPPEIITKCLEHTTWRELSKDAGVSIQSLANWRDGVTEPSLFTLSKCCLAVGYDLTINGTPIDQFVFQCVPSGGTAQGRACRRMLSGIGRLSDLQAVKDEAVKLGMVKI